MAMHCGRWRVVAKMSPVELVRVIVGVIQIALVPCGVGNARITQREAMMEGLSRYRDALAKVNSSLTIAMIPPRWFRRLVRPGNLLLQLRFPRESQRHFPRQCRPDLSNLPGSAIILENTCSQSVKAIVVSAIFRVDCPHTSRIHTLTSSTPLFA